MSDFRYVKQNVGLLQPHQARYKVYKVSPSGDKLLGAVFRFELSSSWYGRSTRCSISGAKTRHNAAVALCAVRGLL